MMKARQFFLITLLFLPALGSAETIPDPGDWYRNAYAPLWESEPAQHVEELLGFYAETVETHSAGGGVVRENRRAWLAEPMAQWQAEGWLRSKMTELQIDQLNPGTASFKARWVDYYQSAEPGDSCGWYLANWMDGKWQFTTYTDIDCAKHGL
jgi:hypothetical protein